MMVKLNLQMKWRNCLKENRIKDGKKMQDALIERIVLKIMMILIPIILLVGFYFVLMKLLT